MALDLFPLFPRTLRAGQFERSVFEFVSGRITDKKAFSEELAGVENLKRLPPDDERRQKMAAELYLLLERNIAEEQVRNPIPREKLREEVFERCHPQIAAGNFALMFLPHYERQIKLFESFTDLLFEKAGGVLGQKEFLEFLQYAAGSEPLLKNTLRNKGVAWKIVEKRLVHFTPAVARDMVQELLKRVVGVLSGRLINQLGELRTELAYREIYKHFHEALGFIEDSHKVLLLLPDNFLQDERIGLMGKAELEEQLRQKSKALETTIAEVQGEKLKLSELSREELEKKVQERTAELVAALKAAQDARKNLEEFSSIATHELRTPIAAMNGYIDLILTDKTGKLSKEQIESGGRLHHVADRLLTLVNAMLDVSRIELGTLAIQPAPMNLNEIVENVLAEFAGQIKDKDQILKKHCDAAIPMIPLDPSLMHAILMNLISNAVKYTGKRGTVTVKTDKRETDVLLTVEDSGLGIPKAEQAHIFEKMFRADNAREKVPEGTGLGLYLVKSILDQTGGTIRFESEEGKGATFFVTIPLAGMKRREGTKGLS